MTDEELQEILEKNLLPLYHDYLDEMNNNLGNHYEEIRAAMREACEIETKELKEIIKQMTFDFATKLEEEKEREAKNFGLFMKLLRRRSDVYTVDELYLQYQQYLTKKEQK